VLIRQLENRIIGSVTHRQGIALSDRLLTANEGAGGPGPLQNCIII